jgi:hypothetical protein
MVFSKLANPPQENEMSPNPHLLLCSSLSVMAIVLSDGSSVVAVSLRGNEKLMQRSQGKSDMNGRD